MCEFPETRDSLLVQVQDPANREAWELFRRRAKVRRIEADFTLADGYQRTPTAATLQNAVRCSGHIDRCILGRVE